jgi:hypothetical protein
MRSVSEIMTVRIYLQREYGLDVDYKDLVRNAVPGIKISRFSDDSILVIDTCDVLVIRRLLPDCYRPSDETTSG